MRCLVYIQGSAKAEFQGWVKPPLGARGGQFTQLRNETYAEPNINFCSTILLLLPVSGHVRDCRVAVRRHILELVEVLTVRAADWQFREALLFGD